MLSNFLKLLFYSILMIVLMVFTSRPVSGNATSCEIGIERDQISTRTLIPNVDVPLEGTRELRGLICPSISLTTENGQVGDGFGSQVAMDGDVVAISAPLDNTLGEDAGAVYVFRKNGEIWIEEQKLLASDGQTGDLFGFAVASHNGVLVVGSFIRRQVYVYVFDGSSWQEQTILTPWDEEIGGGNRFGISVGIDNDLVVVGAVLDSLNCNSFNPCGSVYVFRSNGLQWLQETKLRNSIPNFNPEAWNWFGASVAIDGDIAVVGNPQFGLFTPPGTTHVFRFDGSTWSEDAILTGSNSWIWDRFGSDVAIHGNELIASSPFGNATSFLAGFAYTFQFDGQDWDETAHLFEQEGTQGGLFGLAIDIGAQFALVSTELYDHNFVTVFSTDGQTWSYVTHLFEPLGGGGEFGNSLAISGTTALIGSVGFAYLYDLTDDSCALIGDVTGDSLVDVADLLAVIDMWGPCSGTCPADLNGSGVVDVSDLLIVVANWD